MVYPSDSSESQTVVVVVVVVVIAPPSSPRTRTLTTTLLLLLLPQHTGLTEQPNKRAEDRVLVVLDLVGRKGTAVVFHPFKGSIVERDNGSLLLYFRLFASEKQ